MGKLFCRAVTAVCLTMIAIALSACCPCGLCTQGCGACGQVAVEGCVPFLMDVAGQNGQSAVHPEIAVPARAEAAAPGVRY